MRVQGGGGGHLYVLTRHSLICMLNPTQNTGMQNVCVCTRACTMTKLPFVDKQLPLNTLGTRYMTNIMPLSHCLANTFYTNMFPATAMFLRVVFDFTSFLGKATQ